MSGGIEAAGDAITGAVIARAVEPTHGQDKSGQDEVGQDGHTHESACLNCGTPLMGSHCHACGQAAHLHRSLAGLWHDIAHGVFHFEGKVWHTLPMLAWRPGDLTRRYIHGERARFVSPLALFLFSVFLMFAVFESVGGPIRSQSERPTDSVVVNGPDFKAELAKTQAQVVMLEKQRAAAVADRLSTTAIDKKLEDARTDITGLATAAAMVDGVSPEALSIPGALDVNTGVKDIDERVKAALKNPKLLLYKLQSSAYKFAWALIPLSLPFMWVMFAWRRQYKLYDHAVFVTYSLSSVMLLLVTMALLAAVGISTDWALFLVPAHFYWQLKYAYALGIFSAVWRTIVLLLFTAFVLTIFALILLLLGILG